MEDKDIRWLQRYDNYRRACSRLLEITDSERQASNLTELEKEGLIQRFEYTFELAWKVLQDFLKFKGYDFVQGPNGALKGAFEDGMISNHDAWMRMAKAMIATTHTYDEDDAMKIVESIYSEYSYLLKTLNEKMAEEKELLIKNI